MNNILFFPLTGTNWSVMSRLAFEMKLSGQGRPILVVSNKLVASMVIGFDSSIEVVFTKNLQPKSSAKITVGAGFTSIRSRLGYLVKKRLICLKLFARFFVLLKKKEILIIEREINQIFLRFTPSAVIVSGDRNSGVEPSVLKISNEREIPAIIPPIAFPATIEGLLVMRREHPGHDVTKNKWFKKMFPKQWIKDPLSLKEISFFSQTMTQAYYELFMLPPNPWVMGAGFSNTILADSDYVRDCYLRAGVFKDKIKITGHLDHDSVAYSLSARGEIFEKLADKYRLDRGKKVILLLLTNWLEHNFASAEWHWNECDFLCQVAESQNVNVLIALHPTQKKENYLPLEQKFSNIRVLDEPLAKVLGVADIMLVGWGSSTVLWAVMAKIPVVIADHYREKDHLHKGLPGVRYVENSNELSSAVASILLDDIHRQTIKNGQTEVDQYFGQLDMQSTQRIINFICTQ